MKKMTYKEVKKKYFPSRREELTAEEAGREAGRRLAKEFGERFKELVELAKCQTQNQS